MPSKFSISVRISPEGIDEVAKKLANSVKGAIEKSGIDKIQIDTRPLEDMVKTMREQMGLIKTVPTKTPKVEIGEIRGGGGFESLKEAWEKGTREGGRAILEGFKEIGLRLHALFSGRGGRVVGGLVGMGAGAKVGEEMGGAAGAGLGGMFGAILGALTPLVGILGGVMALVAETKPFEALMQMISTMMTLIFTPVGTLLLVLFKPILILLLQYFILPFYKYVMPFIRDISKWWNEKTIRAFFENLGEKIVAGLVALWTNILSGLGGLGEAFKVNVVQPFVNFFQGAFQFGQWLWDNIVKFFQGIFRFDEWMAQAIWQLFVGIFQFDKWLAGAIWNFFIGAFHFGQWLSGAIEKYFINAFDFAKWLLGSITKYFVNAFDFAKWLLGAIWKYFVNPFSFADWFGKAVWKYIVNAFSFADWFWNAARKYIINPFDIGGWLWLNFSKYLSTVFDIGNWLWGNIGRYVGGFFNIGAWLQGVIGGMLGGILSGIKSLFGRHQAGITFVPSTGLAVLHAGEAVLTREQAMELSRGRGIGTVNVSVNVNTTGQVNAKDLADEIAKQVERKLYLQIKRWSTP